jgi:hypothetical protein
MHLATVHLETKLTATILGDTISFQGAWRHLESPMSTRSESRAAGPSAQVGAVQRQLAKMLRRPEADVKELAETIVSKAQRARRMSDVEAAMEEAVGAGPLVNDLARW